MGAATEIATIKKEYNLKKVWKRWFSSQCALTLTRTECPHGVYTNTFINPGVCAKRRRADKASSIHLFIYIGITKPSFAFEQRVQDELQQ